MNLKFVIKEHRAKRARLHHDLRLQMGGRYKSWAIPKLVTPKFPGKRLALKMEDHPIPEIEFEGEIAEGPGAGVTKVWDSGTYEFVGERKPGESYKMRFFGEKLTGVWVLRKVNFSSNSWLFFRSKTQ